MQRNQKGGSLLSQAKELITRNDLEGLKNLLSLTGVDTTISTRTVNTFIFDGGRRIIKHRFDRYRETCLPQLDISKYGIVLLTHALQYENIDAINLLLACKQVGLF